MELKTVARTAPQTPAKQVIPKIRLEVLQILRKRPIATVRDFYRNLAGLGGFLIREGDGDPGWITLWRGTEKLLLAIRGYLGRKDKLWVTTRPGALREGPERATGEILNQKHVSEGAN